MCVAESTDTFKSQEFSQSSHVESQEIAKSDIAELAKFDLFRCSHIESQEIAKLDVAELEKSDFSDFTDRKIPARKDRKTENVSRKSIRGIYRLFCPKKQCKSL